MFDSFIGFILMILGLQTPPMVKGETTTATMSATTATASSTASSSTGLSSSAQAKLTERRNTLVKRIASSKKLKDAFLAEMIAKRASASANRAEKHDRFMTKLAEMKDEKKKVIAERVENNLTTVNTNRTTAMGNHLTTMSAILGRISEKAEKTEKDTTKLLTLIADAEKKISEAMTAVSAQAAKTYSITITQGETNLKSDATSIRIALSDDLKAVHEKVKAARVSVLAAIKELGSLLGESL